MARLLGIGDNTVDLYLSSQTMYPGGNAVNVAALSARLGHPASYLGCVGTDAAGQLILAALGAEGVDLSHCRQVEGMTSWSGIDHRDGDRHFVGSDPGVQGAWTLTDEDLGFMAQHDLVHTSIYSELEAVLPRIRQAAPVLSFDFSSDWTPEQLGRMAPLLDVAFLSAGEGSLAEAQQQAAGAAALGARLVVVTRGAHGSLALLNGEFFHADIVPAAVVDTLGAGDAFIAAFLHCWFSTRNAAQALAAGANEAARNCATFGAFGHGTPIPEPVTHQP
ncbi:fructoselysine kinase [Deinococcus phoenicis]|uniref:Fructoselysine kinase n=1 Tax=Deinococcus phoenicis TaxID=1476583 RepID=A0A016QM94_9DEIO|nr:PfkB family carbohydrate kinase [Deinococcus phoenicis]EYB67270.1 fructoselysine kinase [Deinococcus phoenicis]